MDSKSDSRRNAKANRSSPFSEISPVCSKRRKDAGEMPARRARVLCFQSRISRNC